MARGDVSTVGMSGGNQPRRVAASATRFYAGEPLNSLATHSSGAANVNTVVVLTDTKPRVATDTFQGIAGADAQINSAGTVIAHRTYVSIPIPHVTRIRALSKAGVGVAPLDTDAAGVAILFDFIDFDLTTAKYTWDATAVSNASSFTIVDFNLAKGTIDCTIDPRGQRNEIS